MPKKTIKQQTETRKKEEEKNNNPSAYQNSEWKSSEKEINFKQVWKGTGN